MKSRRFVSLRTKILLLSLVVALTTMLITVLALYKASTQIIENSTKGFIEEKVNYANDAINAMVNEAMNISIVMSTNREILDESAMADSPKGSYARFLHKKKVGKLLGDLTLDKPYIENAIYVSATQEIYQSTQAFTFPASRVRPLLEQFSSRSGGGLIMAAGAEQEAYWYQPISHRGSPAGALLVKFNLREFGEKIGESPFHEIGILTFTLDGELFYSSQHGFPAAEAQALFRRVYEEQAAASLSFSHKIERENYFVVGHRNPSEGSLSIGVMPYADMLRDVNTIRILAIQIGVVAAFFAAGISILFSSYLSNTLRQLKQDMGEIEKGNFDFRTSVRSNDEIGEIAQVFNATVEEIQRLILCIREREVQKQQIRQDMLYKQIQPHFICNTINALKYSALARGETELAEVATAVSGLIRDVFSTNNDFVTLLEESRYIDQYVVIQRFRHKNSFTVDWDVEELLWGLKIPRFLIQPLVENAIVHGISNAKQGQVSVRVFAAEEEYILQVIDNGKGMTEQEIKRIWHPSEPDTAQSIGLSNVFQRIQTVYGADAACSLESYPGAYTKVEIRFRGWSHEATANSVGG